MAPKSAIRIGQIEVRHIGRRRVPRQRGDEGIRHAFRDGIEIARRGRVAALPGKAGTPGVIFPGRVEPDDAAALDHLEPAAHMHRRGGDHLAVLDHGELGGAAADIDVEDALVRRVRQRRGAGAVGGEHRLHVVPGGGADELAALFRDDAGDRLRVLAPQRLAGEDHRAGIDGIGVDARGVIGIVDDGAEPGLVDVLLAAIGGERDGRLEQGLPRHHEIAARQVLAEPSQVDAREDHLGPGRADVDADAGQGHMVLDPDRVILERDLVGEIVVVIGIAVMGVLEVDAIDMVGQRVTFGLGIIGLRHRGLRRDKEGLA